MVTTTLEPLFDVEQLVKQMIVLGDSARTRLSDPLTSHMAADRSQASIPAVKAAVVSMLRWEGSLCGSELNALYQKEADLQGWPLVHWDSPRKRAGELAADGKINVLNDGAPRGTEREYTLIGVAL